MTFGEALREARLYRELQYTELAEKCGRRKPFGQYLGQVERGDVHPAYNIVETVANGLGVEFYYRPGLGWGWRQPK